jgi:hypothetical protein
VVRALTRYARDGFNCAEIRRIRRRLPVVAAASSLHDISYAEVGVVFGQWDR